MKEIRRIREETGIEIETFIHGAMCYCYSGQCLFSSILGGRSGNRGRCAQPCRLPYATKNQKECYPLSMKDMCTLEILPELLEAGIDSFKIEGRMKKSLRMQQALPLFIGNILIYIIAESPMRLLKPTGNSCPPCIAAEKGEKAIIIRRTAGI